MAKLQALRAWLLSCFPSGTKIIPIEAIRIILALMRLRTWAESRTPFGVWGYALLNTYRAARG
jgi:hypothetical protein